MVHPHWAFAVGSRVAPGGARRSPKGWLTNRDAQPVILAADSRSADPRDGGLGAE